VSERLLTRTEVARLLGVTSGSVKRWADLGLLRCARTAGRHRRFEPGEVQRFLRERTAAAPLPEPPSPGHWVERLTTEYDVHRFVSDLYAERARLGSWWRVAESMGPVLEEMGDRWSEGTLSILDEHMASERLARTLAQVSDQFPVRAGAPRLLLATAEGEEHTLGLSLVELAVREHGWPVLWAGRNTPLSEIVAHVAAGTADAVAVSASLLADPGDLLAQAERLGSICRAGDVPLLLGGSGSWPEWIPYGARVATFEELRGWLVLVEAGRGPAGS
jgi:excisionase family DNA binding protein